ncbi:MAG TPA: gephyrin-like molybdotransferase receptor GlpR [Pseudonocardiaceae bacterium]|nr:gephyrin-like molybdotransferase receptor GlpR [Pseudonocardiaceae bacterium]
MPSSLIIVALVVAWLLVLVPIAARRRQEVAKTADSSLAARVVRSGGVSAKVEGAFTVSDSSQRDTEDAKHQVDQEELELALELEDELDEAELEDFDDFDDEDLEPEELQAREADELAAEDYDDDLEDEYVDENEVVDEYYEDEDYDDQRRARRPYRPGRGGFDVAAAAASARAKYAIRQRIVLVIIVLAIATAVLAVLTKPVIWWAHGLLDIGLISYLSYLRRQVRIEDDIRRRRAARLGSESRDEAYHEDYSDYDAERDYREADRYDAPPAPRATMARPVARPRPRPGTVVVETDDDDPIFDDLDQPGVLPYRRAVGE